MVNVQFLAYMECFTIRLTAPEFCVFCFSIFDSQSDDLHFLNHQGPWAHKNHLYSSTQESHICLAWPEVE